MYLILSEESQMLQQDLDPHEYQDHSAGQLRPRLIFHPKYITGLYPDC